tara:strand:- start:112 stop:627 length:516 start_codon:yes stop_codon:yes gene_type:complete
MIPRLQVQKLLHTVLTHEKAALLLGISSSSSSSSSSTKSDSGSSGDRADSPSLSIDDTHENSLNSIFVLRAALFKCLMVPTNEPENIHAIVKNLYLLLQLNKASEVTGALPLLFHQQERANGDCEQQPLLAKSLHTVGGAYLFSVAKMFGSKSLQEYVLQVMEKRKKDNQV